MASLEGDLELDKDPQQRRLITINEWERMMVKNGTGLVYTQDKLECGGGRDSNDQRAVRHTTRQHLYTRRPWLDRIGPDRNQKPHPSIFFFSSFLRQTKILQVVVQNGQLANLKHLGHVRGICGTSRVWENHSVFIFIDFEEFRFNEFNGILI